MAIYTYIPKKQNFTYMLIKNSELNVNSRTMSTVY